MMKRTIRKYAALFAALMILFINICVFADMDIPEPTSSFFVNDYANVLDSRTENYIFEKGREYNNGGGTQVAVLTMESIGGASAEEFSIETARSWGLGDKDKDNGVLILLVIDSRDIRIEVGYGLEGVLNDGKCGRFIRRASPMLSAGDYSGGIKQIYDDVIGELEEPTSDEEEDNSLAEPIVTIIVMIIILIIWSSINRGGRGGGSSYRGRRFFGGYGGYGGYGGGFSGGGYGGGSGGFGGFSGGGAGGKF